MKNILIFAVISAFCIVNADAASRTELNNIRGKNVIATTASRVNQQNKTTVLQPNNSARTTKTTQNTRNSSTSSATRTQATTNARTATRNVTVQKKNVVARAAATTQIETKTGAAYEQCKNAFFSCMDQFCQLKNDNFRRCSCNDRVYDFEKISETYQQASERLTEFSENLNAVGLTREQALAMKTASEGEDALTEDKSASKQLLQAIMNSINGEKTSVGGKYQNLNSISLISDMANAFGTNDSGQIIASYNGTDLYKAVYPTCRKVVEQDCDSSAALQRAINAYLMAIEQDCNTVEAALQTKQQTLKAATKQSSAMLDLARVENRKKHNTDDIAVCVTNVETAIQSEEVCGANYHKCLDYGQFIDVSTGAPLTGVADFYKLGELLTFRNTDNLKDQKLSSVMSNRAFVQFFEDKTKKFASEALDKCTEQADTVWQTFLDSALLDIYYAQRAKVEQIQNSCFDIITACYENQDASIAQAMANLNGDSSLLLKPARINLTSEMCSEYIDSCNNMFSGNIVEKYIANKDTNDSKTACRAIAKQCFTKFGGSGYENFFYPNSGLFEPGKALDWFSLYEYKKREETLGSGEAQDQYKIEENIVISPCAQELVNTDGCNTPEILEYVFGGFDKNTDDDNDSAVYAYRNDIDNRRPNKLPADRQIRSNGIATEVYYTILDNLATQCENLHGYFVEYQYAEQYGYKSANFCKMDTSNSYSLFYISDTSDSARAYRTLNYWYHFIQEENICPLYYAQKVDTQSWGACSCWENGGYRSKNGTSQTCMPILPIYDPSSTDQADSVCDKELIESATNLKPTNASAYKWCQQPIISSLGQLCPTSNITEDLQCADTQESVIGIVSEAVPHHKVETVQTTSE